MWPFKEKKCLNCYRNERIQEAKEWDDHCLKEFPKFHLIARYYSAGRRARAEVLAAAFEDLYNSIENVNKNLTAMAMNQKEVVSAAIRDEATRINLRTVLGQMPRE
jgi:flagellar biosynthesis chaperone FliJ